MLRTHSKLKQKWPKKDFPHFHLSFGGFFCVCIVHESFCMHTFFLFPFQSLKLSNRFVAGIRLPHAKVNKDLVELLHPEVTLFFSISRQPVSEKQRTQWIRCILFHLCFIVLKNVKLIIHWSLNSRGKNAIQYSTSLLPSYQAFPLLRKLSSLFSEDWNGTARQIRTKLSKQLKHHSKVLAFKWALHWHV